MFSNWIQAVENLAQHSPKSSQDLSAEARQALPALDKGRRGSQSLGMQRSASPAGRPADGTSRPRTTLEDRIRAKLASAEATNSNTPSGSSTIKQAPTSEPARPLSPASTPLPDSPALRTVNTVDPFSTRSPSPAALQSGQPEPGQGGRNPSVSESRIGHASSIEAAWHPLSPTSTPLPDSPPLSPSAGPLQSATAISLYNFVSQGSLYESPEPVDQNTETEDAAGTHSFVADSHPSVSDASPTRTLDSDAPAAKPHLDGQSVEEAGSIEQRLPSAGPTDVAAARADEQLDPADDQEPESESIHSPLVGDSSRDALSANLSATTPVQTAGSVLSITPSSSQPSETEQAIVHASSDFGTEDRQSSSDTADEIVFTASPDTSIKAAIPSTSESAASETPIGVSNTGLLPEPMTPLPTSSVDNDGLVEGLQKRLKLVEQRFADVSTSFKRLQAEKLAADSVLQELTPLQSVQEVESLRDYLQNINMKTEMAQDEIKRLTGKLTRQEERIEELRDIHRLESKSQTEQIDKLKAQIDEAEALLKGMQSSTSRTEEESARRKAEIERLQTDMDHMKGAVKDEEEKRIKAVGLLKTVRQKLVKAEKDRDDALKEVQGVKDKDKGELEKERAEKAELKREIERMNMERETALSGLKAHFDKEVAALKEKHEKELAAMKSQFELEAITTKTSLVRDIENRDSRIADLESLVRSLEGEKDEFFDQLQLRQAELESSRSRLESLEGQTTEFQYQLREANDRIALLTEELLDARREQETKSLNIGPSAEQVSRLLSAAESKYEARISDLRNRLTIAEREREEGDALWSRKLADKTRELDSLRDILNSSARSREQESENVGALKEEIDKLKEEMLTYQLRISDMRTQADRTLEAENGLKSHIMDVNARVTALQQLVEEGKAREAQLRAHNKTLREELRKVQSSAALLERQRNPGVGYWASRQDVTGERSPRSSIDGRDSSSRPSSPALSQADEEVNIQYLRNVIMQFLEHKEMRPDLVRILSTILRFTPQETRRLVSKV